MSKVILITLWSVIFAGIINASEICCDIKINSVINYSHHEKKIDSHCSELSQDTYQESALSCDCLECSTQHSMLNNLEVLLSFSTLTLDEVNYRDQEGYFLISIPPPKLS